ncbi:hypothetical protein [Rhodococcus jostii]|uniref:hypothetical protein n=1 Tax=Rhodococcus jostii TaxID=132919 RepID=UPI0036332D60
MSYGTTLEAEFFNKSKVLKLMQTVDGERAVLVLLQLRQWSASDKSDGAIPSYVLRNATQHDDPESALALLVSVGLAVEIAEGWQIEWKDTGQKIAEERGEQAEYWKLQKRHQRGNHETCPNHWQRRKAMSRKDKDKESSRESRPLAKNRSDVTSSPPADETHENCPRNPSPCFT